VTRYMKTNVRCTVVSLKIFRPRGGETS